MTRYEALEEVRKQLEWRGPNGKMMGHVVLTREVANKLTETDREQKIQNLFRAIIENDPNDDAADGVSVLQVWRKEIERLL